jgi:hypothetical protein
MTLEENVGENWFTNRAVRRVANVMSSVVKAEMRRGTATPKIDAARGAGAISVTRTLIYLILKYYNVKVKKKY